MGLLVLTRRRSESIVVGVAGDIIITVEDIRGDRVRISVQAPNDVPVDRIEVRDRKDQEEPRR